MSEAKIGGGWDLATTTKATSNPSSLTIMEQTGVEKVIRAIFNWKTNDPAIATERVRRIVEAVRARKAGGPMRRLCIDGTGERYFAHTFRKELSALVPVEIVIASETILLPGQTEAITRKQHLGGLLVAELDDNHLTLPADRYVRDDWRMVKKEKGQFVCEPDADGKHGDTFDGAKLANWALSATGGAIVDPSGIRIGNNATLMRGGFQPRRLAAR